MRNIPQLSNIKLVTAKCFPWTHHDDDGGDPHDGHLESRERKTKYKLLHI